MLARDIPSMRSLGYSVRGEQPEELVEAVRRFFAEQEFARQVARRTATVSEASNPTAMAEAVRGAYAEGLRDTRTAIP